MTDTSPAAIAELVRRLKQVERIEPPLPLAVSNLLRETKTALQSLQPKPISDAEIAELVTWLRRQVVMEYDRPCPCSHCSKFTKIVAALQSLVEAQGDAERYRWLRKKAKRSLMTSKKYAGEIQVVQWADKTEANVLYLDVLDAAIDAALTQGEKP